MADCLTEQVGERIEEAGELTLGVVDATAAEVVLDHAAGAVPIHAAGSDVAGDHAPALQRLGIDEAGLDGVDGAGERVTEVGAEFGVAVGSFEVELEEAVHDVGAEGPAHGVVGVEEAAVDSCYVLFVEHEVGEVAGNEGARLLV